MFKSSQGEAGLPESKSGVLEEPNHKSITSSFTTRSIEITHARTHNLKSVSVQIPHRSLSVVTGVSGSGKSSLALDTIYAEGQRRYIESLSTYARQFLERLEKPDVEKIEHILPAVALEQNNRVTNARSTVGTVTEITDYLRVLFAHMGRVPLAQQLQVEDERRAKQLNISARKQASDPLFSADRHPFLSVDELVDGMVETCLAASERTRLLIGVERVLPKGIRSKADWGAWVQPWIDAGYTRYIEPVSGEVVSLDGEKKPPAACLKPLLLLVDRLVIKPNMDHSRFREALESSLHLSKKPNAQEAMSSTAGRVIVFNVTDEASIQSGYQVYQHVPPIDLSPNQFSFNHPQGACEACDGFGRVTGLDERKIVPNPTLSLADGAVHPFTMPANEDIQRALLARAREKGVDISCPYQQLSEEEKDWVWSGDGRGEGPYEGITPFFRWLETKRYKMHVRIFMAKYRGYDPCPECGGARLNGLSRSVTIERDEKGEGDGFEPETFGSLAEKPLLTLRAWLTQLSETLSEEEHSALERVLYEAGSRIDCLNHLGLGYLTLSRHSRTLSGGEMQRIQMASALGSWLTETLYVLDEPTVGLHPRDTERLLDVLKQLRSAGNTLLLVEHDPDVMMEADFIMDMGPKAGRHGGELLYAGSPSGLLDCEKSATAQALKKRAHSSVSASSGSFKEQRESSESDESGRDTKISSDDVVLRGVTGHNLNGLTVNIPTGKLVVVTGVSGSGKSTLIKHGLYANAQHAKGKSLDLDAVHVDGLDGLEQFDDVVMVDQSPPGRSQRSNPATYLKAYDGIRKLFGGTRRAKVHGLSASDFSFNRPGGRCEKCEGMGFLTIDMQFMADVTVTCPQCRGRRFEQRVLAVDVNGKNIEDVLNMTVDDAIGFFEEKPKIVQCLKPLQDIGLGYLQLGQSTSTLSGGEAQRLKLAAYLLETETKSRRTAIEQKPLLFLFDEPTTGLHMQDIDVLLKVLRTLIKRGHSVVVIEHHTDVMRAADHLIDMGPEGGSRGGRVVAQGHPEAVKACEESLTGAYL